MSERGRTRTFTITLPESGEALGRWLESRNASVAFSCSLGRYHVSINCHKLESYRDEGRTSFHRSSDFEVSVYDEEFDKAMAGAMRAVEAEETRLKAGTP